MNEAANVLIASTSTSVLRVAKVSIYVSKI